MGKIWRKPSGNSPNQLRPSRACCGKSGPKTGNGEKPAGSICSRTSPRQMPAKHTRRLAEFGMSNVNAKVFDINEALSKITKAPI